MISLEAALGIIRSSVPLLGVEKVPLAKAAGRVLVQDLRARTQSPLFDHSSMDGYAVCSRDTARSSIRHPARLELVGRIEAGDAGKLRLERGEAIRILTGAPLPRGADAVVMQELVDARDKEIWLSAPVAARQNVRFAGADVRAGSALLEKGRSLSGREIALLASQGYSRIPVVRQVRASVVVTGSEIKGPQAALRAGQIRNANGPGLAAALGRAGALVRDFGIVPDQPAAMRRVLRRALAGADLLLVSGGVSVGDKDLTRAILEDLGFRTRFWKVAVRPGKPLLFGMKGRTAVFGLPGNPVSAWVCCEEFVRPAMDRMLGRIPSPAGRWPLKGCAENDFHVDSGRRQFAFCRILPGSGEIRLRLIGPHDSGRLAEACRADALALIPAGARQVRAGAILPFRLIE